MNSGGTPLLSVRAEARQLVAPDYAELDGQIEHTAGSKAEAVRWVTGSLDQLTAIARALGTSIDQLVESADDDVVIRPQHDETRGITTWTLNHEDGPHGMTVAKMRVTRPPGQVSQAELRAHPGRDWFTVLSGTVVLFLGERTVTVEPGQAAEFSTMIPHGFGALGPPAEIIGIFDHDGQRTHLRPVSG